MKFFLFALMLVSSPASAEVHLAPNAPVDKPEAITGDKTNAYEKAIAPYVAKARASYPEAKRRYLAGLPPQETFFITTRLHDSKGKWEQVFIAVEKIESGKITGFIASKLNQVSGFKSGQRYTFPEADLLDWLISKPDGSEEGNVVGKFLDTHKL